MLAISGSFRGARRKSSRSLSHLLMSSCNSCTTLPTGRITTFTSRLGQSNCQKCHATKRMYVSISKQFWRRGVHYYIYLTLFRNYFRCVVKFLCCCCVVVVQLLCCCCEVVLWLNCVRGGRCVPPYNIKSDKYQRTFSYCSIRLVSNYYYGMLLQLLHNICLN